MTHKMSGTLAVLLVACATCANAGSIGFQFVSDRDASAALNTGSTAGAPGYEQPNWNTSSAGVASGTNGAHALIDDSGEATAANIEWASDGTWNTTNGTGNPDAELMNGYIDETNGDVEAFITISNIPYAQYQVVAYIGSDGNGRTGEVTDGTTTYSYMTFSNEPNGGPFTAADYVQTLDTAGGNPSANYAVFSGLTGGSVTLEINRGSNNSGFHAVQIVEIPEPGTIALAGLSLIGIGLLRRRG